MTLAAAPARGSEYPFSDGNFALIAAMAKQDFGLHLDSAKKSLVYSRLARRLRALKLPNFDDYCRVLEAEPEGGAERRHLLSALTTNVTQFFREAHHFETLARDVLPPLIARARDGGRVRLWSAGCSTGPEPYSIAATLLEPCPEAPRLDIRILATDIDPQVLAVAEAGRYATQVVADLPQARQARLFDRRTEGGHLVRPELRRLVAFRPLNLIGDWPMSGRFDVIFCRNVAIYFDPPTQERLWQRFAERLAPGGHLFIGHSERLTGPATAQFSSAGVTVYRRAGAKPAKPRGYRWD